MLGKCWSSSTCDWRGKKGAADRPAVLGSSGWAGQTPVLGSAEPVAASVSQMKHPGCCSHAGGQSNYTSK